MADITIDPGQKLPTGFQFTQSKLQDFADCPRRFYLRHVIGQPWPSPVAGPQQAYELALKQGQSFHRTVERHQTGISLDTLRRYITDPDVNAWLDNYLRLLERLGTFDRVWPEVLLSTTVAGYPLVAKFDLIALQNERVVAIDWKTGRLPDDVRLRRRMQSQVYAYVLHKGVANLVGLRPRSITLSYASVATGELRSLAVDSVEAYEARILEVIEGIATSDFAKAPTDRPCRFCVYRGLCERGTSPDALPGDLDPDDVWVSSDILEVEF